MAVECTLYLASPPSSTKDSEGIIPTGRLQQQSVRSVAQLECFVSDIINQSSCTFVLMLKIVRNLLIPCVLLKLSRASILS